jgi:hypothetical protein
MARQSLREVSQSKGPLPPPKQQINLHRSSYQADLKKKKKRSWCWGAPDCLRGPQSRGAPWDFSHLVIWPVRPWQHLKKLLPNCFLTGKVLYVIFPTTPAKMVNQIQIRFVNCNFLNSIYLCLQRATTWHNECNHKAGKSEAYRKIAADNKSN